MWRWIWYFWDAGILKVSEEYSGDQDQWRHDWLQFHHYSVFEGKSAILVQILLKCNQKLLCILPQLFPTTSVSIQSTIIELLCQLLEFDVEYITLDPKNVFLDYILQHVEAIKSENYRGADTTCPEIIKFFWILAKSEKKDSITNPKIFEMLTVFLQSAKITLKNCGLKMLVILAKEVFEDSKLTENCRLNNCECGQKEICLRLMVENLSEENEVSFKLTQIIWFINSYNVYLKWVQICEMITKYLLLRRVFFYFFFKSKSFKYRSRSNWPH